MNSWRTSDVKTSTPDQALAIAAKAAEAFASWSRIGPRLRRELLLRVAQLVDQNREQFIECMQDEVKTSRLWAEFNVRAAGNLLKECAALTTQITGQTVPSDVPGCLTYTERTPAGVVLGIAPWNAPLLLGLRAIAMPLACGNTVILKGSEACPHTHRLICDLFAEAGSPEGVVNFVLNSNDNAAAVMEALISHDAVRRVNFTGSTKTGRIIGKLAGEHLKPALLELGGKAPLIVLADADIEQAVNAVAFGAFMNSGQICMSTELVIVDESIADVVCDRMRDKVESVAASAQFCDPASGGMINSAAAEAVDALIDDAIAKGAQLLTARVSNGAKLRPLIVDHVRPGMRLYEEESFGPVAAIVRVRSADEAVRVANEGQYGLAAAVFGRDIMRTLDVARRLDCGVCHINGPTVQSEPQMPFGGVKASGYGRFNGTSAIAEFTELRSYTIQTAYQKLPF